MTTTQIAYSRKKKEYDENKKTQIGGLSPDNPCIQWCYFCICK